MTEDEVRALFTLAGISVLDVEALIDGYTYDPKDSRFFDLKPRCVWWHVRVNDGWVKIGWRKRVIEIEWKDTSLRDKEVTLDDVTKGETFVHAWSIEDAVRYLRACSKAFNADGSVSAAIRRMLILSDEERLEVINHFCKGCGTASLPCHCQNDE